MRRNIFILLSAFLFSIAKTEVLNFGRSLKNSNIKRDFSSTTKVLKKRAIETFSQVTFNRVKPVWKATSNIQPEGMAEGGPTGVIDFQPIAPYNLIRVVINGTGFPVGKHAVHIHVFGDLSQGCKSTGPHMLSNFIGNVEAKEDGIILSTFLSPFISIFGINGILGRSVVIHEKPIVVNPNISPYFTLRSFPVQSEEKQVGLALACGSILFANNLV